MGAEITEGRGSRVRVALKGVRAVFHRPHPEKETDHAQETHKGHAIEMFNFAIEGKSPWTRCNDNPSDIIYDTENVAQYRWLSGEADDRHKETMLSWLTEMSGR